MRVRPIPGVQTHDKYRVEERALSLNGLDFPAIVDCNPGIRNRVPEIPSSLSAPAAIRDQCIHSAALQRRRASRGSAIRMLTASDINFRRFGFM